MSTRHLGQYNFVDRPAAIDELGEQDRAEYQAAQSDPAPAAHLAAKRYGDWVARLSRNPESLVNPAKLPDGDRWFFEDRDRTLPFFAAVSEAFRQGTDGIRWELIDTWLPWGFRLDGIQCPVRIWHGEQDPGVARAYVDFTVDHIPDAVLVTWSDAGHFGIVKHWNEVLAALT